MQPFVDSPVVYPLEAGIIWRRKVRKRRKDQYLNRRPSRREEPENCRTEEAKVAGMDDRFCTGLLRQLVEEGVLSPDVCYAKNSSGGTFKDSVEIRASGLWRRARSRRRWNASHFDGEVLKRGEGERWVEVGSKWFVPGTIKIPARSVPGPLGPPSLVCLHHPALPLSTHGTIHVQVRYTLV